LQELRADNPNVSFPITPDASTLASFDVYPYTMDAEPTYEPLNQTLSPGDFTETLGVWTRAWDTVDFVPDSISQVQFVAACQDPEIDIWAAHQTTIESYAYWPYVYTVSRSDPTLFSAVETYLGEEGAAILLDRLFRIGITK
jgi:hypothetical protein